MLGDWIETFKIWTVNGTVLGVTTLSSLEIFLKIVLLVVTIIWTVVKIVSAIDTESLVKKKNKPKDKDAKNKAVPRRRQRKS